MAYGLKIENNAGELVVDSDLLGMHYIGKASYVGIVDGTVGSNLSNERYKGRYQITLASADLLPIAGFKLVAGRLQSLERVRRASSGSATWYFDLYSIDATTPAPITSVMSSSGFDSHLTTDVYVFTQWAGSGDPFGLRLYSAAGAVTWDFGLKPFMLKEVLELPLRTDQSTYLTGDLVSFASGVTTPMIIGPAHGRHRPSSSAGQATQERMYLYGLESGQVRRQRATISNARDVDGPALSEIWSLPAQTLYVLDTAAYD
jgi:hypothetical protein